MLLPFARYETKVQQALCDAAAEVQSWRSLAVSMLQASLNEQVAAHTRSRCFYSLKHQFDVWCQCFCVIIFG
jgi:hypothetical protein